MIKIAIIDDENAFVEQIRGYLQRFVGETGTECSLTPFTSGVDFISDYSPLYDIVFMDIEMPIMNGMETAQKLRQVDQDIPIVFMTNMAQMAIKGYEVNALDFMVKPISYMSFAQKLKKAVDYIKKNDNFSLALKTKEGFRRVYARDIRYIEVFGHFLIYHTMNEDLEVRGVLSQAADEMEPYGFLRCSNCFLVNLHYVETFDSNTVSIGGMKLPISRRRKKDFSEQLANYFGGGK